jgi:hypothetical protein
MRCILPSKPLVRERGLQPTPTPHGVQKEDEKTPQGNELKAPLRESVVSTCASAP